MIDYRLMASSLMIKSEGRVLVAIDRCELPGDVWRVEPRFNGSFSCHTNTVIFVDGYDEAQAIARRLAVLVHDSHVRSAELEVEMNQRFEGIAAAGRPTPMPLFAQGITTGNPFEAMTNVD
jgi:hypothetical protein